MNVQTWLNNPKTIKKSKKMYAHFDCRVDIEKAAKFISNPENIASYGFYPFIHYTMKMRKYNKKTGKDKKTREICYAAHMDRCIYQYYAYVLNEYYNKRVEEDGIATVPVAYRTNLKDSNIQSAKRAFDFIRSCSRCYVMIGDFTSFFDNLEHQYLKKQWCSLLNVSELPADHYAVFKNITKYSKWELDDLLELNGLGKSESDYEELNRKRTVLLKSQYRQNRKHIVKNTLGYGIPQGSPISAALANVYMLEADKAIYEKVKQHNGFYMRYSDDFIVVLPEQDNYNVFKEVIEIINRVPRLYLENRKTQFFKVELSDVLNVSKEFADDANDVQKRINFLGFSYDGKGIYLRAKTVGKHYYRMNRKAKSIAVNEGFIGADNLYMRYSERGAYGKRGNFFTYVNNAEKEFGTDEMIRHELKNNMSKIRKSLKKNSKKMN